MVCSHWTISHYSTRLINYMHDEICSSGMKNVITCQWESYRVLAYKDDSAISRWTPCGMSCFSKPRTLNCMHLKTCSYKTNVILTVIYLPFSWHVQHLLLVLVSSCCLPLSLNLVDSSSNSSSDLVDIVDNVLYDAVDYININFSFIVCLVSFVSLPAPILTAA